MAAGEKKEAHLLPRTKKPGTKRLLLTSSVLFSFLLASPFLLKSIHIHRSPLPFASIHSISQQPIFFPCSFHALFLSSSFPNSSIHHLHPTISTEIRTQIQHSLISTASCSSSNFTLHVSSRSNPHCVGGDPWCFDYVEDDDADEVFDELLGGSHRGYTVVVLDSRGEDVRAVVGKHRHAWIRAPEGKLMEVVRMMASVFVEVFSNGGSGDGVLRGENMPAGSDGRLVFSFSLLNSDPFDWVYTWDFQRMCDALLNPLTEALVSVGDISLESQVLYHTPLSSSRPPWDYIHGRYVFPVEDLPFFVNSNEWHLDNSVGAGGRSKVLHFVVYVPSARECPLFLGFKDGGLSETNGFVSPMWGGVVVWNPPRCRRTRGGLPNHPEVDAIPDEDLRKIFEVFVAQIRQLLGLNSERFYTSRRVKALTSSYGFTEWEVDFLSRQHTRFNVISVSSTLGSLSRLVKSLPRMVVIDEIGRRVMASLSAARSAVDNASNGEFLSAAVASREARSEAEDAFFHPSVMSVSYYSFEHCFAIYSPFFMPVFVHVLLASVKECTRYRRRRYEIKKRTVG